MTHTHRSLPPRLPRSEIDDLSPSEIERLVDLLDDHTRRALHSGLNIKVRGRSARGGLGKLCKVQLRKVSPRAASATMVLLTRPVLSACVESLGEHAENPTVDQVRAVVPELVESFGVAPVRIMFLLAIESEAPAAPALQELLGSEPILQPPAEDTTTALEDSSATPDGERTPQVEQPQPSPAAEGAQDEPGDELPEDDAATFTALDNLLISAAVAAANDVDGAHGLDDVVEAIAEFAVLNVHRHSSLFHVGFLEGMTGRRVDVPPDGQNDARRRYELFGRLCGYIRRDAPTQLLADASKHADVTASILADTNLGYTVTTPLVRAALQHEPQQVPTLVAQREAPFADMVPTYHEVRRHGRSLLLAGHAAEAEEVFAALQRWCALLIRPHAARADLARRIAACRRARRDWAGARAALAAIPGRGTLSPDVRALLTAEEGLIDAEVVAISGVHFPESSSDAFTTAAMLRGGVAKFDEALAMDGRQMHAALCLGVLAWCEDDSEGAARYLGIALAGIGTDDLLDATGLGAEVRLHRALATLMAGDVTDGGEVLDAIEVSVADGRVPSGPSLDAAVQALAAIDSPHFPRLIHVTADIHPTAVLGVLDELRGAAAAGRPGCAAAAQRVAQLPQVGPVERLDLLTAAAEGYLLDADKTSFAGVIEDVEDLLGNLLQRDLDEEWAETLGASHLIRDEIGGTTASLTQVQLWRRSGNVERAAAELTTLCYRAAAGELPGYRLDDLLGLLVELGADETHLETLRSLDIDRVVPEEGRSNPVSVLFIGGNEVQARYDAGVEAAVHEACGDRVSVHWLHSGWETNWSVWADRAASLYPSVDVIVLMQFMRTNLGIRLRREVGEAGLQWRACTGHGKSSILNAILEAVAIADGTVNN